MQGNFRQNGVVGQKFFFWQQKMLTAGDSCLNYALRDAFWA
jgi:hypothetical protein